MIVPSIFESQTNSSFSSLTCIPSIVDSSVRNRSIFLSPDLVTVVGSMRMLYVFFMTIDVIDNGFNDFK